MNFISKSLFILVIGLSLFFMGCVNSVEGDQNILVNEENDLLDSDVSNNDLGEITPQEQIVNTQNNAVQEVEVSSKLGVDAIDCGENLNCLIQAVQEEKEAKAVIESIFTISNRDYINKDYLEVRKEGQEFVLYRRILLGDAGSEGICYFTKEQLEEFLSSWNTKSFETNYYAQFNCEGNLYTIDGGFE